MRRSLLIAALVAAGPGHALAQAQTYAPEFDPDRFVLTADARSIALLDSARPLKLGDFSLGFALRAGGPPLQLCVENGEGRCVADGDVVSNRFGTDVVAAVGLGRLGLYAQMPVVLHQGSDFDAESRGELSAAAFGDLRLGVKALLVGGPENALGLDVRGVVPTGKGEDLTGDGSTSIETRGIFEHRRGSFAATAQLGYSWRQDGSRIANLYVDDEVLWGLGAEYAASPSATLGLAVFGRVGVQKDPNARMDAAPSWEERPAEIMGSARFRVTKSFVVEAGAGTAIIDGYGAPNFRALLGVRFILEKPPCKDTDGDGLMDNCGDIDKCPNDPEDFDKYQDDDGCPDPDNDGDKILDVTDQCPNDPEDFDAFEDENGCPDPDNDKDTILDVTDQCPNDPEDFDQWEDENGCPDPDNDKDTILDGVDQCVNVPEDPDGFEDTDGCPDLDNDKDGIQDKDDKCPNVPETFNGTDDQDGCPDTPPTVVVTDTAIEIKETIYFDLNKATIKQQSFKLLEAVAGALKAHSHLRISVEGHTDDQGDDAYNLTLSRARANSVRTHLIDIGGIDASRLEAVGFGETRPKIKAKTKAARDINRRVEFIIIPPAPGTPAPGTPAPGTPAPGTPAPATGAPAPAPAPTPTVAPNP